MTNLKTLVIGPTRIDPLSGFVSKTDWEKRNVDSSVTKEELIDMLYEARKFIINFDELRSELKRVKSELKTQEWRNSTLAKQVHDLTSELEQVRLSNEHVSIAAKLRAAELLQKTKAVVIERKSQPRK